jgi:hypothetical protein
MRSSDFGTPRNAKILPRLFHRGSLCTFDCVASSSAHLYDSRGTSERRGIRVLTEKALGGFSMKGKFSARYSTTVQRPH